MTQQREGAVERKPTVLIVEDEPQIVEFLRVGFGCLLNHLSQSWE